MKEFFILSCAETDAGGGIYKCRITDNGRIGHIKYLPCAKPMYAVVNGNRLHVLLRSPFRSSVNSGYFSCKSDLSDCSEIKNTIGQCACHLAVDNDVYIANYLSGNVVKNCEDFKKHMGCGVNAVRQEKAHTHFVTFSPDKKYVLCCDLGLDTVFVYDRNLKPVSSEKVPDGYGVRHAVFSRDGKFLYSANELIPSVSVFGYGNGSLTYLKTVELFCGKENSTAAAIRLDESKLYVSVREENKIFVLQVNGEELKPEKTFACGGDSPRDFDIIGNYIVCANENSDSVTVIEKTSGKLIDKITVISPLNIVA